MQYNNDQYSPIKDALIDSPYVDVTFAENILPPPPMEFLLDNSGQELLDNTGTNLLSDH